MSLRSSAGSLQLVHVRQKPIDELPAWAFCCDANRKLTASVGPVEALVIPAAFLASTECRFCGRITPEVKYMRVAKKLLGFEHCRGENAVIAVDCFEFDEGIATA